MMLGRTRVLSTDTLARCAHCGRDDDVVAPPSIFEVVLTPNLSNTLFFRLVSYC